MCERRHPSAEQICAGALGGDREPRISWAVQARSGLGAIPVTTSTRPARDGGTTVIRNSPGAGWLRRPRHFHGGRWDYRRRSDAATRAKFPIPLPTMLGARTWFGYGAFRASLLLIGWQRRWWCLGNKKRISRGGGNRVVYPDCPLVRFGISARRPQGWTRHNAPQANEHRVPGVRPW